MNRRQKAARERALSTEGGNTDIRGFGRTPINDVWADTMVRDDIIKTAEDTVNIDDFETGRKGAAEYRDAKEKAGQDAISEFDAEQSATVKAEADAKAEAVAPDDSGNMGGYDDQPINHAPTNAAVKGALSGGANDGDREGTAKGFLDKMAGMYGDNPAIWDGIITAAANYIATGNPYKSIAKGMMTGLASKKAAGASKAAINLWTAKENYKAMLKAGANTAKLKKAEGLAEVAYSKDLTARLEGGFESKKEMSKFFPAGLRGQVSGALQFMKDNFQVKVTGDSLAVDTAFGVGIENYKNYLARNPKMRGKAKVQTFLEEQAIVLRGKDGGIPPELFTINRGDNVGQTDPESAKRAFTTIKNAAKKFGGDRDKAWGAIKDAYLKWQKTDPGAYETMAETARDGGTPPFIWFINHEANLIEK